MNKQIVINIRNILSVLSVVLVIYVIQTQPILAGFNEEAKSYFQTHIVQYLKGFSLLSLVAALFLLIGGRPEGSSWATKIFISLVVAANAEEIIDAVWNSFV
ncbi:MAG: hypothetical protein KAQ98_13285 [Bacteriovoracaceae bacterium]|nr:hypothetical protein [Bacteriovoracaceae bacterium]